MSSISPLVILLVTVIGFGIYFHIARKRQSSQVDKFFQAGRNIGLPLFTQTSWGSSFAFGNSIFYAVWLGFSMGLSALWLQLLWAVGMTAYAFLLPKLIPHTEHFTLHGFLGSRYGGGCRVVASIISALGLIVLLGFELSFAAQYFSQVTEIQRLEWLIVLVAAIFFATFCSIGGFQANSRTDRISNLLAAGALILLVLSMLITNWGSLLPALSAEQLWMSATGSTGNSWIAIVGIAFFSLFNFVDMANWQTVSANSLTAQETSAGQQQRRAMRSAMLRAAGFFLIAPVLTGTFLGYMLRVLSLGTEDQAMFMSTLVRVVIGDGSGVFEMFALAVLTFIFVASSLSGVDSWMLATAQTVSWDMVDYKTFKAHDFDVSRFSEATHRRVTQRARVVLLIVAVVGAGGVYYVSKYVWGEVFALQYVIFGGGLAMLPSLLYAVLRSSSDANKLLRAGALLSIILGYAAAISLFLASIWSGNPRLVEPLPLVSLGIAVIVFGLMTILSRLRSSGATNGAEPIERVEVA